MRVIAGKYKGRKISAPPGRDVRPTTDKVKEAVFSMLESLLCRADAISGETGAPLSGKTCLDLFAGSGGLGIEALSRGAASCAFVEAHPAVARILEENIGRIVLGREAGGDAASSASGGARPGPAARVIRSDWRPALRRMKGGIDVAFADPPYDAGPYDEVMKTFLDYGIISDGGFVVIERAVTGADRRGAPGQKARGGGSDVDFIEKTPGPGRYEGFELIREKRYGKTRIEIYVRAGGVSQAARGRAETLRRCE
jgi:16S rRNA (guanine966-N2)-methyltransferase